MDAIQIRPFRVSDQKALEAICLDTAADSLKKSQKDREYLLWLYCRYYTDCCPDTVFVADDGDGAIGYILCAPEYRAFLKSFRKTALLPLLRLRPLQGLAAYAGLRAQSRFGRKYSAHLHIDILPACQRMGLGTKLMDALCAELKRRGVNGVFLTVDAKNEKGVRFYQKYGFKTIQNGGSFYVMGLRFV